MERDRQALLDQHQRGQQLKSAVNRHLIIAALVLTPIMLPIGTTLIANPVRMLMGKDPIEAGCGALGGAIITGDPDRYTGERYKPLSP